MSPSMTTESSPPFEPDEVVDIVIRGALVDHHGDHALTITVPGCDMQLDIPLCDDNGAPLPAVTITRAHIPTPAPDLDLSALGQDYLTDPAARIAAIAAEFPEYVRRIDDGGRL